LSVRLSVALNSLCQLHGVCHTCGYTPVSEEVRRSTRYRRAAAKVAKVSWRAIRITPSYVDQSVYWVTYMANPGPIMSTHVPIHRRFSAPGIRAPSLPAYLAVPPARHVLARSVGVPLAPGPACARG
jgi:hypothetical protein